MWNDIISDPDNLIVLLPTAVILISAIIYYFGVRHGDTQAAEYGKVSHYFFGVLFIVSYMLEPYLVFLFVKYINEEYISYSLGIERNTFLVFGVIIEFILYFLFHHNVEKFRGGLESRNKFVEYKKRKLCDVRNRRIKYILNMIIYPMNILINFVLSRLAPLIIICVIYGFYKYYAPLEIILLSLTLAFLTFTDIAFCVGFYCARYRENVLYLKNGTIIIGIILKYGSYVNVLTEDGACLINKDDIHTIKPSKNSKKFCNGYIPAVTFSINEEDTSNH